ncbi:Hypothetical predicted protein [Paramuricea clavata]|uniref:Uncharacterized protein n=1 Tax=Paramuricea clavata TaxID=317549 RepID=A0A6S7L5C0_PARCT|nr:Hypothetical predicted protein [Paramuricea clavata]
MMKVGILLFILITASLVSFEVAFAATASGGPDQILTTLKRTFGNAYIREERGQATPQEQYAVLYIHRGGPRDSSTPVFDVSNVCGKPPKNFIKETIDNWSRGIRGKGRDVYSITQKNSPLWPASVDDGPTLAKDCESMGGLTPHPNIATAGRIQTPGRTPNPTNKFHSEYLLKKVSNIMMLTYKTKEGDCPGAVYLYSYLTPCNTCKDTVKAILRDLRISRGRDGKSCTDTPFYLGYTNEYPEWNKVKPYLQKAGIIVVGPID